MTECIKTRVLIVHLKSVKLQSDTDINLAGVKIVQNKTENSFIY
jgi:hypothetical protein